jgi:hypothetical protein
MAKVLGVGGAFFKSADPKRLHDWYTKWLGMEFQDWGTAFYPKTMPATGQTVWSAFDASTNWEHRKVRVRIIWPVYGPGWK